MHIARYPLVLLLALAGDVFPEDTPMPTGPSAEESAPALASNVVARVGDFDVPYDWFLHEFRSSFFRHTGEPDVREAVFQPFLERMTLYALARHEGLPENPALRARIRERVDGMRAHMDYQLAMVEVGMVVQAYLESRGLTGDSIQVGDEDLQAFFDRHVKGKPGAPKTLGEVPAEIREQMRQNIAMTKYAETVSAALAGWKTNVPVTVNSSLIQSVPLPEMDGAQPGLPLPAADASGPAVEE
ncbi:MAG TPA: hypothetical protein P5567_14375 [Kiritimatiellia bacterium]|nr:hypothetical protein [Kiritimatiellia bacterium]HRZ13627.1 hypothetical protein [Kiritimatiellia bacterium]HSA19277.1 hypothetical protein [Kiritimatiellia bacterium]